MPPPIRGDIEAGDMTTVRSRRGRAQRPPPRRPDRRRWPPAWSLTSPSRRSRHSASTSSNRGGGALAGKIRPYAASDRIDLQLGDEGRVISTARGDANTHVAILLLCATVADRHSLLRRPSTISATSNERTTAVRALSKLRPTTVGLQGEAPARCCPRSGIPLRHGPRASLVTTPCWGRGRVREPRRPRTRGEGTAGASAMCRRGDRPRLRSRAGRGRPAEAKCGGMAARHRPTDEPSTGRVLMGTRETPRCRSGATLSRVPASFGSDVRCPTPGGSGGFRVGQAWLGGSSTFGRRAAVSATRRSTSRSMLVNHHCVT